MNKNMKKKALVSSILTIALCFSVIAGATFALFTSKSGVNIAITSGKVDVQASIVDGSLKLSSLGVDRTEEGTFATGGTADLTSDADLVLNNIVPGDEATFKINVKNNSTVDVMYKLTWTVNNANLDALEVTSNGEALSNIGWTLWTPDQEKEQILPVEIKLPMDVSDAKYQGQEAKVSVAVEAIQANGHSLIMLNGVKQASFADALAAAADGDTIALYGDQTPITVDKKVNLEFYDVAIYAVTEGQNALTLNDGFEGTVVMNGENYLKGAKNGNAIYIGNNATLDLSGDTLVAIGNNGIDYAGADKLQYSSDDAATDYEGSGASAIGGEGSIYIHDMNSLTAEGYGETGFGIGGASASIKLENTTVEFVRGGYVNEDGTYEDAKYLKSEPNGGAAIGSSTTGAVIELDGVTVKKALGGSKSAGIGATYWTGVTVNIKNSNIEEVVGGPSAAGIGGSRVLNAQEKTEAKVTINIENSNINAQGGCFGAGIGGGYNTDCVDLPHELVTINISGAANNTVTAVGGKYASGIGTGYHMANLAGKIEGDVVINATSGEKFYKNTYTEAMDIGFGIVDPTREAKDNNSSIDYKGTIITIPVVLPKWDGTVAEVQKADDGYYHITNGAELAYINTILTDNNVGSIDGLGIKVVLDADIDLDNKSWTPIGLGVGAHPTTGKDHAFEGTFDGNGHTIYNVKVDGEYESAGLFGYVKYSATVIENLTVDGITVSGISERVGALAGLSNGVTFRKCVVKNAELLSGEKVGGIVGDLCGAVIDRCEISDSTVVSTKYAGALAGRARTDGASPAINYSAANKCNVTGAADYTGELLGYQVEGVTVDLGTSVATDCTVTEN